MIRAATVALATNLDHALLSTATHIVVLWVWLDVLIHVCRQCQLLRTAAFVSPGSLVACVPTTLMNVEATHVCMGAVLNPVVVSTTRL